MEEELRAAGVEKDDFIEADRKEPEDDEAAFELELDDEVVEADVEVED